MGEALGLFDEKTADVMESVNQAFSELDTEDAQSAIDTLNESLLALTGKTWNIQIGVEQSGTVPSGVSLIGATPQQQGGEVYAGSPVMVGERGREPFMPAQDGRILGHAESLHALSMGSGGGTNYFYGNVTLQIDETMGNGILEYR